MQMSKSPIISGYAIYFGDKKSNSAPVWTIYDTMKTLGSHPVSNFEA
jgi:hypothetical protein